MIRKLLRWVLALLYRVELHGAENFERAGKRVLIVANHTSFLDPILLWAFLPEDVTFAINSQVAEHFWVKPALRHVRAFSMDPTHPMSVKTLTHYLRQDRKAVLFPEGRITVTGSLMKIYDGAGMIADKSEAQILPVRIDGAQYTPFSRLRGIVRLRWFPPISLNILPPTRLDVPAELRGDRRRKRLGLQLEDIMSEMMFATSDCRRSLWNALLDARRVHGGRQIVLEDIQRRPLDYDGLILRALALGRKLRGLTSEGERIGMLLPGAIGTVATLFGLQLHHRVPALLNHTAGARGLMAACEIAEVTTVVTSRRFIAMAKLETEAAQLETRVRLLYLEDLAASLSGFDKLWSWIAGRSPLLCAQRRVEPEAPALILFTSGSEGAPKGVALSHGNLLSNCAQMGAKVDFNAQDRILNALPLFHCFGLTAGTLLPLLTGMRSFLYPSPLHYRIIPEVAYDNNSTILFGTNTFLAGYAKHAHPYDFYSIRYVFAGAEKVHDETRRHWGDKFGLRIMEGYGVTETSPVLAVNTAMHYRAGSVGRLLPGIRYRIEPVEGIAEGGRLWVSGRNIMLGYLKAEAPGKIQAPAVIGGEFWHDTGDLVEVDEDGFVFIKGRIKRFAKIGGEMISLPAVEELATRVWPGSLHAALAIADARKGEQIVLITDHAQPDRSDLANRARSEGFAEIHLPRAILHIDNMPVLATGKLDYVALAGWLSEHLPKAGSAPSPESESSELSSVG